MATYRAASQSPEAIKRWNLAPVGTTFYGGRAEVTGLMNVLVLLRGHDGLHRAFKKVEGKPHQTWTCVFKLCKGMMQVRYEDGRNKPGVVVASTLCSCPLVAVNSNGHPPGQDCHTLEGVRTSLTRMVCLNLCLPLVDFRGTTPNGFTGNFPGAPIISEPTAKDLNMWRSAPNNKRFRLGKEITRSHNWYGKLNDGCWFVIGIGRLPCPKFSSKCIPLKIQDPLLAATKPGFLSTKEARKCSNPPSLHPSEFSLEPKKAMKVRASSDDNDKDDDTLCWICQSNAATVLLPCNASKNKCTGSRLCTPCLSQATMRRKAPMTDDDNEIYQMNEEKYLTCLMNCESSRIRTFVDIENGSTLPILFPYSHSYNRPILDRAEHERCFIAFETIVFPLHKARKCLADDLSIEDTRLGQIKDRQTFLERIDDHVSVVETTRELMACQSKMERMRHQLDAIKIPEFANDWTMTEHPCPEVENLGRAQKQISFSRRPIGRHFEEWWESCILNQMSYSRLARNLKNREHAATRAGSTISSVDIAASSSDEGHDQGNDSDYLPTESMSD